MKNLVDQGGVDSIDGCRFVKRTCRFATFYETDGLAYASSQVVINDE
jgi:hypothetical protein